MRWYNHDCAGINLNRNWPENWSVGDAIFPCVSDFKGNNPGEAIEVKSLMDLMKDKNIMLGIDYQARGQRGELEALPLPFFSPLISRCPPRESETKSQRILTRAFTSNVAVPF